MSSRAEPTRRSEVVSYFRQLRGLNQNSGGGGTPAGTPTNNRSILTQVQQGQEPTRPPVAPAGGKGFNLSPIAGSRRSLIPPPMPQHQEMNLLVLDIDETLVHSSFRAGTPCDLTLPVIVEGQTYQVYIKFRPFLREFLQQVATMFECIVFTASLGPYADGLMDYLDPGRRMCPYRLFREHCTQHSGAYVKDLSLLGRDLHKIIIADNSPVAYLFQPRNAIPVVSWFDDPRDTELRDMMPWLQRLAVANDVYPILDEYRAKVQRS